jgi:hypothetical protein
MRDELKGTYNSYRGMLNRCRYPNATGYKSYGGKGITVCERWQRFENFLQDMGVRPEGKSIDRHPNPAGNYEPGNCRWATPKEQQQNKIYKPIPKVRRFDPGVNWGGKRPGAGRPRELAAVTCPRCGAQVAASQIQKHVKACPGESQ